MKLTIGLSAALVSTAMARTITVSATLSSPFFDADLFRLNQVFNACPFTIW
jgi:hypothetical protein